VDVALHVRPRGGERTHGLGLLARNELIGAAVLEQHASLAAGHLRELPQRPQRVDRVADSELVVHLLGGLECPTQPGLGVLEGDAGLDPPVEIVRRRHIAKAGQPIGSWHGAEGYPPAPTASSMR
jgi:hypothetical protein